MESFWNKVFANENEQERPSPDFIGPMPASASYLARQNSGGLSAAGVSFLEGAKANDPKVQMSSSGVSFRNVGTGLRNLYPANQLLRTANVQGLAGESTRRSVSNIANRNNSFVNRQFQSGLRGISASRLPTPTATGATALAAPSPRSRPQKKRKKLFT